MTKADVVEAAEEGAPKPGDGKRVLLPEGIFEEITKDVEKKMREYAGKAQPVIQKARIYAVLEQPFFSVLLYNLEWQEAWWLETLGTDGKHLFYNPSFVCQISPKELVMGLCHEAWHAAASHPDRKSSRDADRWNQATDHCVNVGLKKSGMQIPAWALCDEKLALEPGGKARAPEDIYKLIPETPCSCGGGGQGDEKEGGKDGQGQGSGKGSCPKHGRKGGKGKPTGQGHVLGGSCSVLPPDGSETEAERKLRINSALAQAEAAARSRGNMPGELVALLDQIRNPMFDYRAILEPFLRDAMESEWDTWAKPDHRMLAALGRMFPSPTTEPSGELILVRDTSGSVSDAEQASFLGFLNGVLSELPMLKKVTDIQCDCAIAGEPKVYKSEDLPIGSIPVCGRGGTDFRPPFQWVADNYEGKPSCLVYLTDLEGPWPDAAPDYPVLWVCVRDHQGPPWGITARIRVGGETE